MLYGRFDFAYDGRNIKMLEYNADTPTGLLEASVAQWLWIEQVSQGFQIEISLTVFTKT